MQFWCVLCRKVAGSSVLLAGDTLGIDGKVGTAESLALASLACYTALRPPHLHVRRSISVVLATLPGGQKSVLPLAVIVKE